MKFQGYLCWKPEWVEQVMDTEALQPPDHVFLATHHPMRMHRTTLTALYSGDRADRAAAAPYGEAELLSDLFAPAEFAFVPILGEAGTGKSHLVRWLAAHIPRTPGRHVLLVPKIDTNLRDVLDRILRLPGTTGPRFDDYRARLFRATSELRTEREAREKLLNNLAVACGPNGPHQMRNLTEAQEYLAANLPHLLYDPFFRETLLADGGVIHRLVQHTLGRTEQVERLEEKRGFREEDLPLQAKNVKDMAGAKAKAFYGQLIGNAAVKAEAVRWLNLHLNAAISELLELRGDALLRLMLEVREALGADGAELVLLIEDFAKLQGIDMQLLEAIIAKPRQEGRGRLCTMRTVLACTTGYFRGLFQTVQTRVDFCATLDAPAGDAAVPKAERERFVARYLNVARATGAELEGWHSAVTGGAADEPVPNRCEECPHQKTCHGAFGAVAGVGLYPFNATAVHRMTERASPDFNPRLVIKDVLKRVLSTYAGDLASGQFPPAALHDHFKGSRLHPAVKDDIARRDPAGKARRTALIDLWTTGEKVADLPAAVHEAFALPPLGAGAALPAREEEVPPQPHPPPGAEAIGGRLKQTLQSLMDWANGGELSQDATQHVRDHLFESLKSRVNWSAELLRQVAFVSSTGAKPFKRVSLNFVRQGTQQQKAAIKLVIPIGPETVDDAALALQGLLLFNHYKHWAFEYAGQPGSLYLRRYARALDRWAAAVRAQVARPTASGTPWDPVPAAVELLAVIARMMGRIPASKTSPDELVSPLFVGLDHVDVSTRSATWRDLVEALRKHHKDLIDIVLARIPCTKGDGSRAVQVIDASQLLEPLRRVRRDWTPREAIPADGWDAYSAIAKVRERLERDLPQAVSEEKARYVAWHDRVRSALPQEVDRAELIQAVQRAADAASQAGVFGLSRREPLDTAIEAFGKGRFDACLDAATRVREATATGDLLADLGRDHGEVMAATTAFLDLVEQFVKASGQRVETEIAERKDTGELKEAYQAIEQGLSDLQSLAADLTGAAP